MQAQSFFGRNQAWILVPGLNPQPWKVGPVSVGRRKGGGMRPIISPDATLVAYQEALREEITGELMMSGPEIEPPYGLRFWFWRQIEEYEDSLGRRRVRNAVDLTNLQKATEDALQGVLIGNDRDVVSVESTMMAQERGIVPHLVIQLWSVEQRPRWRPWRRQPAPPGPPEDALEWCEEMHRPAPSEPDRH